MFTETQLAELKDHLERAQNPLFYFDNDTDGLCSYVILRRYLGRGKGVAVRSFPDLDAGYARKARELNADYVFVLDKPVLSREFVKEVEALGLPLVWIDHHDLVPAAFEAEATNFFVYNPSRNSGEDKSGEPTTYLAYSLTKRKEDLWLAIIGCIADHFLPEDLVDEFKKMYPTFWGHVKKPFDAYYGTEIGTIARALNFGLKDAVSNVVKLQNFLISCSGPEEVFSESPANYAFRKRYGDVRKKYDSLLARARENVGEKLIFFEYSGEISISSDLSNELSYRYPGKYVAVAFRNGAVANLSLRGKNVKAMLEDVLKHIAGSGGGHEDAVGARISVSDLWMFRELLEKRIDGNLPEPAKKE